MVFKARIKELTNISFVRFEDDILYYDDKNCIYNSKIIPLYENIKDYTVFFYNRKLWLSNYKDSTSLEFNIDDNQESGLVLPYFFSRKTINLNGEFYNIQAMQPNKECGLEKYSTDNTLLKKIDIFSKETLCRAGDLIVLREAGSNFVKAYNEELELVWERETNKRCFSKSPNSIDIPMYQNNFGLVVVNMGETKSQPRGEFEINAYHAESGELAWQQVLSKTPDCSHLSGDKVYVLVDELILVLDAASGKVLHQVEHGLNDPQDDYPPANFVYPYCDKLLVISPKHGLVQLRSQDAKDVIQQIHVPLPYTVDFHPPISYEGKVYVSLAHVDSYDNSMKGGVLVMEEDANAPSYIEAQFEPRPPMSVELTTNESGDAVYSVSIEHDNLNDVIRFSTIALKEVAFKYGSYASATDTNKEHHGKLVLHVKSALLSMGDAKLLESLAVIKERVERNLKETVVLAGDGANFFKVDIQLV